MRESTDSIYIITTPLYSIEEEEETENSSVYIPLEDEALSEMTDEVKQKNHNFSKNWYILILYCTSISFTISLIVACSQL